MTNWIYIETERGVYTVGFYDPHSEFQPDSDHDNIEKAAARCSYLNGGVLSECTQKKDLQLIKRLERRSEELFGSEHYAHEFIGVVEEYGYELRKAK